MMRILVCWSLSVVACLDTAPTPVPPAPISAGDVISKMMSTYVSAMSYEDSGTSLTRIDQGSHSAVVERVFATAFVRNTRFRFEYQRPNHSQMIIWSDHAHTYSVKTPGDTIVDDKDDLDEALSASVGTSGGISLVIPSMLMPDKIRRGSDIRLRTRSLDGVESIDGHACWIVKGTSWDGSVVTIWVDRESGLLRRLDTTRHADRWSMSSTITFHPHINEAPRDELTQPPTFSPAAITSRVRNVASVWLGVVFDTGAAKIRLVLPNSPAERAGFKPGDSIISINGKEIANGRDVVAQLEKFGNGSTPRFIVVRGNTSFEIGIRLEARADLADLALVIRNRLLNQRAPSLALQLIDSTGTTKFPETSGQVVVLDFFSGACGKCVRVISQLNELVRRYPKLRVIGISGDAPNELREYAVDNGVTFELAFDADNKTSAAYFAAGEPTLVVIDRHGVVRDVELGSDLSPIIRTVTTLQGS